MRYVKVGSDSLLTLGSGWATNTTLKLPCESVSVTPLAISWGALCAIGIHQHRQYHHGAY
jgi:hypothetical protein